MMTITDKEQREMIHQTEIDTDIEIQNLNRKYGQRLQQEREDYAKLKGDNGIMNKKFSTLNKEIDDFKLDMTNLKENSSKLVNAITKLELVRNDLKKEVNPRVFFILRHRCLIESK